MALDLLIRMDYSEEFCLEVGNVIMTHVG
jgi:hypothetical protein